MRVLHLLQNFPPESLAGVEIHVCRLARALQELNCEVRVVAGSEKRSPGGAISTTYEGIPVVRLEKRSGDTNPLTSRFADRRLLGDRFRAILESYRPDLVHIHHLLNLSPDLWRVVGRQLPLVFSVHDFAALCPRLLLQRPDGSPCGGPLGGLRCARCLAKDKPGVAASILRAFAWQVSGAGLLHRADLLIVPARFVADILAYHGLRSEKMVRIPYGVPHHHHARPAPTKSGRVVFGYLGSIKPHKGLDHLLSAFSALKQGSPARLVIFGDRKRDPHYGRRLVYRAANHPCIQLADAFLPAELGDVLSSIDVLVVPSLWRETGPQVALEALAAGVPVLAADIGGLQELIRHGRNGWRYRPGSATDLQRQIETILQEPSALGALSWSRRSIPDPVETARRTLQAYRELKAR